MAYKRTFEIVAADGTITKEELSERESPAGKVAYYQGNFYHVHDAYPHPSVSLRYPVDNGLLS